MEDLREELHKLIEEYGIDSYEKLIEVDKRLHEEIIKIMR